MVVVVAIVLKHEVGEHEINALVEEQEPYYFRWGSETVLLGATQQSAREIMGLLRRASGRGYPHERGD